MNIVKRVCILTLSFTMLFFVGFSLVNNTYSLDTPVHEAFDDINFYRCVVEAYNTSNDGDYYYGTDILTDTQLANVTDLDCDGYDVEDSKKIRSVKGVEKLVNLKSINLHYNLVNELDLSNNVELVNVDLCGNEITDINLSNLINLTELEIWSNDLTEIDLSDNVNLVIVGLYGNKLTSLDFSNNPLIEELDLGYNEIVDINLKNAVKLSYIDISENKLKNIDLSDNISLEWFFAYDNELVELDISNNDKLEYIEVFDNNLSKIVLNEKITDLDAFNNNLKEIDVTGSPFLEYLDLDDNYLTEIDVSKNKNIYSLNLENNNLKEIDVSENLELLYLYLDNNEITEIDVSNNLKLETLSLNNNEIESLNLSNNEKLKKLYTTNVFDDVTYAYRGEIFILPQVVNFPKHLHNVIPNWVSENEQIVSVNTTDEVIAVDIGSTTLNRNVNYISEFVDSKTGRKIKNIVLDADISVDVNVVELTSDKYVVDDKNGYIYVGTEDNIDTIKSNLELSDDNVQIEINEENMILYVKYGDKELKMFKLINIKFKSLNIIDKKIYLTRLMSREEFIDDFIIDDDRIIIKVFKDDELVNGTKTIMPGMVVKIYFDDRKIDEFVLNESFKLDDSLNIDENNKWILDINVGTTVNDIIGKIITTGIINIKNNKGDILVDNDLVGTGSVVSIIMDELSYEYSIVVVGDVDGDGELNLPDIMKIANYQYINNKSLNGIYLKAADYDLNMILDLSDIMKIANKIYKGGI